MHDNAIAIYCFVHDYLRAKKHKDDPQCKMNDAEVMLAALLATYYFGGNYILALDFLECSRLCRTVLSKSRFSRRLNRIQPLLDEVFETLGNASKKSNPDNEYIMDSFPVSLCHNMRSPRSRLVSYDRKYVGKCVIKREYFYGFRVQMIATADGIPVEYAIVPGSWADPHGMKALAMDLTDDARIMCDAGYTSYVSEDVAAEAKIWIDADRKKNAKRLDPSCRNYYRSVRRKLIETVFSVLTRRMGRFIHATNLNGFLLKVKLFIWCQMIESICK